MACWHELNNYNIAYSLKCAYESAIHNVASVMLRGNLQKRSCAVPDFSFERRSEDLRGALITKFRASCCNISARRINFPLAARAALIVVRWYACIIVAQNTVIGMHANRRSHVRRRRRCFCPRCVSGHRTRDCIRHGAPNASNLPYYRVASYGRYRVAISLSSTLLTRQRY